MIGGEIFDIMWDPYNGTFAYPYTKSRPRYYRPRAPMRAPMHDHVYDHYSPITEPVKTAKNVKTIHVTDGSREQ